MHALLSEEFKECFLLLNFNDMMPVRVDVGLIGWLTELCTYIHAG